MSKDICLLCFARKDRVFIIENTRLQNLDDELTSHTIQSDSYPLCCICYKRLLQCEQLVKQVRELKTEYNQTEEKTLVRLSVTHNCIEVPEDLYKFNVPTIEYGQVKQECLNEDGSIAAHRGDCPVSNLLDHIPLDIKEENSKTRPETTEYNAATEVAVDKHAPVLSHETHNKPHSCDICDKTFTWKSALQTHIRVHTAMSNRVSTDQLEALLDFLNEHPLLARGVGLGSRSKEAVEKQWNDLAHKLNAFGSGSAKSGERWKKYWADLKHKSKTRVAKRRRHALGTGGGPGSQDDLTEVDKKVLAIIGEQAVFGDSKHRIPLSYSKAVTQRPSNNTVSTEVVFPHDEIEILPIASSSPKTSSPSHSDHTTQVYTDNLEIGPSTSTHQNIADSDFDNPVSQQLPQAFQTQQAPRGGAVSPVSRPIVNHPRHRSNGADNTTISSQMTPEWVKELEMRRVEAETKLANAAVIMAESSRLQAETAHAQADSMRVLLELVRRQSDDIRALLEMKRATNKNQQ